MPSINVDEEMVTGACLASHIRPLELVEGEEPGGKVCFYPCDIKIQLHALKWMIDSLISSLNMC